VGRIAPSSGPPCAFASLQRPIATPPHRRGDPEGPARPTMLPSLGFRAPRHMPERGTRHPQGLPAPRRAACEVWVPPSRRPPPSLRAPLRAPERPRASRFEAFSSRRSDPSRGPLPSCRCRRFASLLKGACGRVRLQGLDPGVELVVLRAPRARSVDASLRFLPPERSPHRPVGRFRSRPLPHHALGGMTSRPACVSRSSGAVDVVGPSRGYRLSWDLSPHDRHGAAANVGRAGSWLRLAGRGDSAPDTALNPLVTFRPGPRGSRPGAAVFRCTAAASSDRQCLFSKNGGGKASGVPNARPGARRCRRLCDPFVPTRLASEIAGKVTVLHETTRAGTGTTMPTATGEIRWRRGASSDGRAGYVGRPVPRVDGHSDARPRGPVLPNVSTRDGRARAGSGPDGGVR
jgi:hypothetical protein